MKAIVIDGQVIVADEDRWVTINGRHVFIKGGVAQFGISKPKAGFKATVKKHENQAENLAKLHERAKKHDDNWTNALEEESERRGGSMDIYRRYVMARTDGEKDKLWKEFEKAQKEENQRLKPAKQRYEQAMRRYVKSRDGLKEKQKKFDSAKETLGEIREKLKEGRLALPKPKTRKTKEERELARAEREKVRIAKKIAKIKGGVRGGFDDDVVKVYRNGDLVYHGTSDYSPYHGDLWRWNDKKKYYEMSSDKDKDVSYIQVVQK